MKYWTFLDICFLLTVAETVYFSHKQPELCLPSLHGAGSVVGRVYAYPSIVDNCTALQYSLAADEKRFVINSTGWIIAQYQQVLATDIIILLVTAGCQNSQVSTTVTIRLYEKLVNLSGNITNELLEQTCFSFHGDSAFYIEENTNNVLLGQLNPCWLRHDAARMYQVSKPKSLVSIDQRTSEITLIKQLDRDSLRDQNYSNKDFNISGIQPLRISCEVRIGNITYPAVKRRFNITVMDVNDNPPFFIYHNNSQHISKSCTFNDQKMSCTISEEIVVDIDSYRNNSHAAQVMFDPLDVCRTSIKCFDPNLGKTVCRLMINIQNLSNITMTPYRCKVAVIDTFPIRRTDNNNDNLASLEVTIDQSARRSPADLSLPSTNHVRFYRNSTRLARLLQLNDLTPNMRYTMVDAIFHITPKTGIIYLNNLEPLSTAPDVLTISIMKSSGQNISVDVALLGQVGRKGQCDKGCSKQSSELLCFQACGFGLRGGNCVMRGRELNLKMDVNYGTCTHDIDTCPDRFCDELEDLNPLLCPQDCVTEVIGAAELNKNQSRGIVRAESPCWCEEDLSAVVCHCVPEPFYDIHDVEPYLANDSAATVSMTNNTVTQTNGLQQVKDDNVYNKTEMAEITALPGTICNNVCKIAVGVAAVAVAMISFTLFMLWFTKIRSHRTGNAKRVGSVTSLSATIPSEYPDDRERRSSSAENLLSPKGQNSTTQVDNMYADSKKWEIARERLTLEKTLGEGEFGLVIKASLLQEDKTIKHVAVKMLKHCSSQLEEQDLMSEFNVLKDVSHPNVIRLLGACTVDGPFYLVVEFCENGCLLKYLRRSRLEENGYINSDIRFRCHNVQQQTDQDLEGGLLTLRDLFSFAWQIAKGMSYLSEIKLVHRDLAARNILVASGNVLKVSDFGLTRDVYEADTYLKKSKGRIPVKWLAPESLYAQVYTTRSDLWSYGIVLWEIVTLGAPPYPGIPPERLYNLIIGGYRMDRPENCPEEMYAVMQKCWKYDPADRPSFATLSGIFDRMLQEKTGYMDLSICDGRVLYNKCFNENTTVRTHSCVCNDKPIHRPAEDKKVTLSSYTDTDVTECNNTKTDSKMCNNAETEATVCSTTDMEVTMCSNIDTEVTMCGNIEKEVTMCGNTDTEVTVYGNTDTEVTVCNNTSDDYLTPSSVIPDLDDSKINNSMPLIDTERLSEKLYMCWEGTNAGMGKTDSASKLPKKYNSSSKCNKNNKSVIYPSERISLLTDTGVARCTIKNDNAMQIETTQF